MASVCRRRSCSWFASGATASVISAVSCSTDVATSRGYTLELFGTLSLQRLRIAITTAGGRCLHQDSDPPTPHATAPPPRSPHPTRRCHPITAKETPCCRTTRNRYISSKYSRDPDYLCQLSDTGLTGRCPGLCWKPPRGKTGAGLGRDAGGEQRPQLAWPSASLVRVGLDDWQVLAVVVFVELPGVGRTAQQRDGVAVDACQP